jgi:hypothetical protein
MKIVGGRIEAMIECGRVDALRAVTSMRCEICFHKDNLELFELLEG